MKLTEAQREAIEYDGAGDVCVVAGPGSGKTRVLVSRFAWLVGKKRVAPEQILAVTFTRKAALEMKKRLAVELGREKAARAHVSTIDAFCARLLREHAIDAGLDPDFSQLEPIDAEAELYGWIDAALDEASEEDPQGAVGFSRAFRRRDNRGALDAPRHIYGMIESARNWGDVPRSASAADRHASYRGWVAQVGRRALRLYADNNRAQNLMDFQDLTAAAIALLDDGKDLGQLRYKHILLDENQDTNPQQAKLMRLLQQQCEAPLFAVGDLNQSIYAFRNADTSVFRSFREAARVSGRVVELTDNFRSRAEILAAARLLTEKSEGVASQHLGAGRDFAGKEEPSVEVLLSRRGGEEREARWVARRIVELRQQLRLGEDGRRAQWRDFAVLVRANRSLPVFAAALQWAQAPYSVHAGRSFFQTPEVRDLLAFLRALDNPLDEIHLAAALRSPLAGVGDAALLALKADGADLYQALANLPPGLAAEDRERAEGFRELFKSLRARRESMSLKALVAELASKTGFDAWLLTREGGLQRSANVQKFAGLAGRAMESTGSFRGAVRRLDAMSESSAGEGEASLPDDSTDAVRLLTVHAAKGLEFPVVVLGSIQNPGRPDTEPILFHPDTGVGVRWSDMQKDEGEGDPPYAELYPQARKSRQDEDGRLFYVAMTRAEDHLVLSAGWQGKVQKKGWVKLASAGFGIEPAKEEAGARTSERAGVGFRLMVTDEEPERPSLEEGSVPAAAPLFVDRAAATLGQADSEAAVTAVTLFGVCPRRYYLSRYLQLEGEFEPGQDFEPDGGPSHRPAVLLGRETHELLAGVMARADASAEARELARAFERHPLAERVADAAAVERERAVLFPVGPVPRLLRGVIDLYFEDPAGSVLVDYKTDRVTAASVHAKAEEYALQMRLYALALEAQGRRASQAILFFLRLGQSVEVPLDPQSLSAAAQRVEELFQAQESQQFPVKIGGHCRRCPHYRSSCPAELPRGRGLAKGQLDLFAD